MNIRISLKILKRGFGIFVLISLKKEFMTLNRIKTMSAKLWSGGKTTELFISPDGSDYALRNFDFRLSTATVEISESIFTALPKVSRLLMVLEGEMELIHEGQHRINLLPLDVDCFDGGWKTASIGKCVDFNLMIRNDVAANLKGLAIAKNTSESLEISPDSTVFIYLFKGEIQLELDGDQLELVSGDLVKIEVDLQSTIHISAHEKSILAKVTVEN